MTARGPAAPARNRALDSLGALVGQLDDLVQDTGVDSHALGVAVLELVARLSTAVPSFVGLIVTMVDQAGLSGLTTTATAPGPAGGPARTSLGFSIQQRSGSLARLTLYAGQPGAFVDLDADLNHLGRDHHGDERRGRVATDLRLDQDLPAPALVTGVTGQQEQSTLSRAEGALIEQGVQPDDAASRLRQQAAAAGLDPHPYARRLLAALPVRDPRDADETGRRSLG